MQLWFPEASSSWMTMRRAATTLGDSVLTTILGAAGMAQDATSDRAPCTSTTQTRQAPVGMAAFRWQRVGMSMPCRRAASRTVSPLSNVSSLPSMTMGWVCAVIGSFGLLEGGGVRAGFGRDPVYLSEPTRFVNCATPLRPALRRDHSRRNTA